MKTTELQRKSYTVIYEPAEDGGYIVRVPALEGCVTQGDSLEEARTMAKDAIEGYLAVLVEEGMPVPPDVSIPLEPIKEKVSVSL